MPIDTSKAASAASPLWIIALFIALSEATTAVAAIATAGPARLIFTMFAVSFPVLVLVVFVWLLVNHAPKLYAPGQYNEDITPELYAMAVGRRPRITAEETSLLGRAVADAVVEVGHTDEDVEEERQRVYDAFEQSFRGRSIIVSVPVAKRESRVLYFSVTEHTTVSELLAEIYFELPDSTEVFSYGRSWVLVKDGRAVEDLGSNYHARKSRSSDDKGDDRSLAEVGIHPGDELSVRFLSEHPDYAFLV